MIRVLIVDDAAVVRHILKDVIDAEDDMVVVGAAANGQAGVTMMHELVPDAVVMDIEMPVMTGLEALTVLREEGNEIPVIVFSTVTDRGAEATIDALALGARDYVTKPTKVGNFVEGVAQVREELLSRIRMFAGEHNRALARRAERSARAANPTGAPAGGAVKTPAASSSPPRPSTRSDRGTPVVGDTASTIPVQATPPIPAGPETPVRSGPAASRATPPPRPEVRSRRGSGSKIEILAIASSTGGPGALEEVLCGLPADLPVPVVVVQHMPPMFTARLAERLDKKSSLTVVEATAGLRPEPATVYLAPGDYHLELTGGSSLDAVTALNQNEPENFCRPSADVLFRSVARLYRDRALGLVLTGMGEDGMRGAVEMAATGAEILAQDEATSVVWGMPGAVAAAGITSEIIPLGDIAAAVCRRLESITVPLGRN